MLQNGKKKVSELIVIAADSHIKTDAETVNVNGN